MKLAAHPDLKTSISIFFGSDKLSVHINIFSIIVAEICCWKGIITGLSYWHALEETEHKAVAFDVYEAVGGYLKMRRRALLLATYFILKDTFRGIFIMLKQDGQLMKIRTWVDAVNFLFIKPGILRKAFIPWLQFFKKDFIVFFTRCSNNLNKS